MCVESQSVETDTGTVNQQYTQPTSTSHIPFEPAANPKLHILILSNG